MKQAVLFLVVCMACSCQQVSNKKAKPEVGKGNSFTLQSKAVSDSFTIFMSLPEGYKKDGSQNYPVVYLLDANFNFDIMHSVAHTYAMYGLLPQVIIVGIGYKDGETMNNLRDRDLTYPTAPAADSFAISGGGDKFFSFIKDELIPHIDDNYATDKDKRILAGHSLAGYFTLYALEQYALGKDNSFHAYIAGSPSLEYGAGRLQQQFDSMAVKPTEKKPYAYLTMGGWEDAETEAEGEVAKGMEMFNTFNRSLQARHNPHILSQSDVYSAFGHMDTPIPTFTKGLQWVLNR